MDNNITRPAHYVRPGVIEPIDFINSQQLNFNLGNVVKYVTRAGHKAGSTRLEDLKKARQYINFEIECAEREEGAQTK